MREERKRDENAEPTFGEILRQEKLPPGDLRGYTDPLRMWVRHDGRSVIPGYNRDLLPSPRDIAEHRLERKKRLADGKPEPKIDSRMDNSVSNIMSYFKKHVDDKDKVNDKETYKTIVFENYVVRISDRLARRVAENKRREADREEADRRRVEDRKRRDRDSLMRKRFELFCVKHFKYFNSR